MSAADLVAQLAAAGTPPELLAAVAQELFAGEIERKALADRRRHDRERKAEERARSRDVAGQSVTGADRTRPPPEVSPKNNIQTPSLPPSTPVTSSEVTSPDDEIKLKPEHVVEVWNDLAVRHGLAAVKRLTPERRKKLNTFIRRHSIDDITEAIAAIPRSPFLLGQNGRGWRANFDWFLEPRNLTKLTEATYAN